MAINWKFFSTEKSKYFQYRHNENSSPMINKIHREISNKHVFENKYKEEDDKVILHLELSERRGYSNKGNQFEASSMQILKEVFE